MVVNAPRKLLRWAYLILIGWATLVSVLITGYMGDQGFTHNFSLILVHRLNDAELYPNDPFAETAYSYASVYWYIVAWLNRWFALEWILGVFFVATRVALVVAAYQIAQTLFPRSEGAQVAALIAIAAVPTPLVGAGAPIRPFSEQTTPAVVAVLLSLVYLLRRRWATSAACLGTAASLNLMYAVFGLSYWIATAWADPELRRCWHQWVKATPLALLAGLPGIALVAAAANRPVEDWTAVWQTTELAFTGHFYMRVYPVLPHLLTVSVMGVALGLSFVLKSVDPRILLWIRGWTLVALFWYVLAWLTPTWLPSLTLLRLHPIRGHGLWLILIALFFAGVLGARLEALRQLSLPAVTREVLLFNTLIHWQGLASGSLRRTVLVVGTIAGVAAGGALLYRWARARFGEGAFPYTVFVVAMLGLTLIGALRYATVERGRWSTDDRLTVRLFAEWAHRHTARESVFLIPLVSMAPRHEPFGILMPRSPSVRWESFRHLSQRNVFVTWHDGGAWPYVPYYCSEWLRRMRAIGFLQILGYEGQTYRRGQWVIAPEYAIERCAALYRQLDDQAVHRLRQAYRIDYWIVPEQTPSRFPAVFRHNGWKVLRLPPEPITQ